MSMALLFSYCSSGKLSWSAIRNEPAGLGGSGRDKKGMAEQRLQRAILIPKKAIAEAEHNVLVYSLPGLK